MPDWSRCRPSRRRLLAGVGTGVSALAVWGLSPLITSGSVPSTRPRIVGHRGASGLEPPNTAAAIQRAIELGVDGVELDVRRTRDGTLMLFHDPVLDWDSTGHGWIRNTTWEEIQGARIDGEPLISLARALELLADTDVSIYLELKEAGYTDAILEMARTHGVLDRVTVISFEAAPLEQAQTSDVPTGLVGSVPTSGLADEATDCGAGSVFSHYVPRAIPRFLETAREAGLTAGVWKLVDTKGSVRDALTTEPDVFVTNRPDYAFEFLNSTPRKGERAV